MSEIDVVHRDQLHEQVWSAPVQAVASRYGISGAALAKICRKLDVPVPGRGYWAKAQAGHTPRRKKLPALKERQCTEHRIWRRRREVKPSEAMGESPAKKTVVPETLTNPHPLVKKSASMLRRKARKTKLTSVEGECLDIRVSVAQLDRALRIADALVKGVEAFGHSVEIVSRKSRRNQWEPPAPDVRETQVVVEGTGIGFHLEEGRDRVQKKNAIRRWSTGALHPDEFYYVPNGRLILRLDWPGYRDGYRRTWGDGKRQRVKKCLDAFIATAVELAEKKRKADEKSERRQRRREEEKRARQLEESRLRDLEKRLALMEEARRIEALLDLVRESGETCDAPDSFEEDAGGEWLRWIEARAAALLNAASEGLVE